MSKRNAVHEEHDRDMATHTGSGGGGGRSTSSKDIHVHLSLLSWRHSRNSISFFRRARVFSVRTIAKTSSTWQLHENVAILR